MRRTVFLVSLVAAIILSGCQKHAQLSTEQKVRDFEVLYQTLKENYPYFGVALRQSGIDWLAKKEQHLLRIRRTANDTTFFFVMESIIGDLWNGHTEIRSFNCQWESLRKGYKDISKQNITPGLNRYAKWVKVLDHTKGRPSYWAQIVEKGSHKQHDYHSAKTNQIKNFRSTLIPADSIAIMRIQSFRADNIQKDKKEVEDFLKQIQDYRYLVIDIQNNSGGSDHYWLKNIVERLAKDTIECPLNFLIKDGKLNRHFYPDYFENASVLSQADTLPRIPKELLDGTFYIKQDKHLVAPANPFPFDGKIFLLVNQKVYSASENFTYFCKTSGWATIAGERTGGDGICADPVPFILPESGIIVRMPSITGLNPDGSINFETRTIPNVPIEGDNPDQRLQNLIHHIRTIQLQ